MAEFSVRSDSVNVEQIMEQIRARIRDKRGVDYTEEQIRELATVKLQKFLDPRGVRSDLLEQFRKTQPPYTPPQLPNFAFEDKTLFDSHRAGLRFIRKLLNPILKLFFNPNPLIQALNIQSRINTTLAEREARLEASRRSTESLYYELIHNLVVETTRLGIEVKNLSMRIESMSSRLEFNERRARALEGAVVYRPGPGDIVVTGKQAPTASAPPSSPAVSQGSMGSQRPEPPRAAQARPPQNPPIPSAPGAEGTPSEGPGQRSRRRRRRRGRRGGASATATMQGGQGPQGVQVSSPGGPERQAVDEPDGPDDSIDGSSDGDSFDAGTAADTRPSEPAVASGEAPTDARSTSVTPPTAPPSSHEPDGQ
jgi:hypothetical protein